MKNMIVGFVALAGIAAGASAQSINISVMSRANDAGTWSELTTVNAGSTVQVGIFMSGDGVYGFAGATLRLTATGGLGDTAAFAAGTATGRVGPFNFGAATNQIFATGDGFRIDAASDAANSNANAGLTFFQRDPATAAPGTFSTANPALCFRFDVTTSANDTDRFISMALDQLSRDVATYYANAQASRPTQLAATLTAGRIHVVPTPASLALVGLGGLVASRRRAR